MINLNSWSIEQQLAFARKGGADWDEDAGQRKQTTGGLRAGQDGAEETRRVRRAVLPWLPLPLSTLVRAGSGPASCRRAHR